METEPLKGFGLDSPISPSHRYASGTVDAAHVIIQGGLGSHEGGLQHVEMVDDDVITGSACSNLVLDGLVSERYLLGHVLSARYLMVLASLLVLKLERMMLTASSWMLSTWISSKCRNPLCPTPSHPPLPWCEGVLVGEKRVGLLP